MRKYFLFRYAHTIYFAKNCVNICVYQKKAVLLQSLLRSTG